MKRILAMHALALFAAAAACGGSTSESAATDAQFLANAPSYDHVALVLDDSDAIAPSERTDNTAEQAVSSEQCHPHLFSRTHEIAARLNRHTDKMMVHIRHLIAANPKLKSGSSRTWESVENGVDRKLTLTANADGSFSSELEMAVAGANPTFVKVASGTISTSTAGTVTTTNASLTFDYDALHSVIAAEKAAGKLTITVKMVKDTSKPAPGIQRTMTIGFANFLPEEGDLHGPRNGSYTHLGEPGIGGFLTFSDSLILLCPANPSNKVADTVTVGRWFKASGGSIHGRSDAKASGGQMQSGQIWEGVACFNGKAGIKATAANEDAYWMMKLEDGSGNTIQGNSTETAAGQTNPCDAAFGSVPSLTNDATDFDFTKTVSFPGQW